MYVGMDWFINSESMTYVHVNHMGPNMACKITKIIKANEKVSTSLTYL